MSLKTHIKPRLSQMIEKKNREIDLHQKINKVIEETNSILKRRIEELTKYSI
jgi:N-methylhydantoinase B/oxoprolinase/acetone carboxylase alpha subunit